MDIVDKVAEAGTILLLLLFVITSTAYAVAELLPLNWRWVKSLRTLRLVNTLELLKALNIDVEKIKEVNSYTRLPNFYNDSTRLIEAAKKLCAEYTSNTQVLIGKTEPYRQNSFVNIMGASTDADCALLCAQMLLQKIKTEGIQIKPFDFICGTKDGSPYLAYELAKLLKKPLILWKTLDKIKILNTSVRISEHFDGYLPAQGQTALLVDDSSTGGTLLEQAAIHLKELGFATNSAVILFEPIGKDARECLKATGVNLFSVTKIEFDQH